MRITLTVEIEVERVSGKFASKDDVANEIIDQIMDPGSVAVDESQYEVTSFEVSQA